MGISICRNVKLANVFYRLELIEAYGTGILKIMEAYAGTGKEPKEEDAVIALAKKQEIFTRKDVENALGISQTTCGRLLKQMIGKGQIIQEGKSRNTHYRLAE